MKAKELTRDILSLAIGTFGIIHQELTNRVSIELLVVYLVLLGFPAAANLFGLLGSQSEKEERRHRERRRDTRRP